MECLQSSKHDDVAHDEPQALGDVKVMFITVPYSYGECLHSSLYST